MTLSGGGAILDVIAILPAAGIGSRMKTTLPKQYLTIGEKTLLEHSIDILLSQPRIHEVIVAISPVDCWYHQLPVAADPRVHVVTGGGSRADSVMAALRCVRSESWVLVHDAVRPCLHKDDLCRLLAITAHTDVGGILASPVHDTMKRARPGTDLISSTVERDNLWHALTPQLFARQLLQNCLERALAEGVPVTDDASALEYCGHSPLFVPGRADNIKVTRPEDLTLVRFLYSRRANMERL
ncbi:2-C-methyl-D-erythritol 4-phosphate cytidylyltransferase [secondary endosymbiont of Ctenarytaina eucalypti]|uniref:2-C-methyl-D-erythritol 4-phosphate cytidylyltransferase n=1 Tax=secondary endosymbiont of Ctenarytaina eucalypti TaxID=1199245 RepID=J3Z318_9ENTR|nr:2-C-methyl-D-erythritol 4-phosphate cytidylyltransferase [secondary endosymbiont of Ctenarytaina eucalypti]AFP84619.1 2-C-methyl-D-erythritol 4-phosphate cytidylyltransferase [secondary endosymbiont of Ctenarytaina eucalypti]